MELSSLAGTSLASLDFASKYHPCQSSIVVVPVHESAASVATRKFCHLAQRRRKATTSPSKGHVIG